MEHQNNINSKNELFKSYDFIKTEETILQIWEANETFQKLKVKNKGGKKYRFIDGPITANNPMGIHHVWGRTLKDTFLRYKAMNGYDNHYRNGFDSQGLWVEVEVEKEFGITNKHDIEAIGVEYFTQKCMERVKRCSGIITEQSKRLGQWMDWDNSYYTNTNENIEGIWTFLKKCSDNQWLKKIHRPMPWCPRCGTSLSEHEMSGSYKELEHEAVFVKLPLKRHEEYILVWTTTPWTLAANVALAVNANIDYVLVKITNEEKPVWMSKEYYFKKYNSSKFNSSKFNNSVMTKHCSEQSFNNKLDVKSDLSLSIPRNKSSDKSFTNSTKAYTILKQIKGWELKNLEYETCFPELPVQKDIKHRIVLWDTVSADEGCGVVHIAPSCGAEDFDLGIIEQLSMVSPIDETGVFYENYDFLSGKSVSEAKELIFKELASNNKLFYTHPYKHSYPICWRCKHEILFRLVDEWAIDVNELRPRLINNARKVKWTPSYQGKRMEDWLNNMGDWCISRSRFYGLPLPIYECKHCKKAIVIGSINELKEKSVEKNLVEKLPHLHRPWIDQIHIVCPDCSQKLSRINQVGDVWLDAGIVPFSTLQYFKDKEYWKSYFPAEFVIEMKEQIRLWFYSMLFMSTVLIDEPPYEQVSTYGMVTAEDGTKFSKTGFMIHFDEAANQIGADASRYIFASTAMTNDVRFGYNLGNEVKKKLLNFYNIATFFMTYAEIDRPYINLNDLEEKEFNPSDQWLLARTAQFVKDASIYYNSYNTKDVILLFEAIVEDVSNFYIRINRKRFWVTEQSVDKEAAFTALLFSIKTINQVMAPIVPFITEYIWINLVCVYSKEETESVHLSDWPLINSISKAEGFLKNNIMLFNMASTVRELITLALKVRNEKKIKIKQKLGTAFIWLEKSNQRLDCYFEEVLKSEINVEKIVYLDSQIDVQEPILKLNFKLAGDILKKDINQVIHILKNLDKDAMNYFAQQVLLKQYIKLPEYKVLLQPDLFLIEYKEKENIGLAFTDQIVVALDTYITKDLANEGLLRSLLRQCQIARKNAGFQVGEKIYIKFICDKSFGSLIEKGLSLFESELLAEIKEDLIPSFEMKITVEDHLITIYMSKK